MAKAIVFHRIGGPEVLELAEIPSPQPGPGEVAIRVEAIGVNPLDGKIRAGLRFASDEFPRRVGLDGAGVVTALGEGVEGLRIGDPVAFASTWGAYATEVVTAQELVALRPAAVSPELGAAIGGPAGTAYSVLRAMAVGPADTLLIHGGSGSVGRAMTQFARLLGARVIATCSERRAGEVAALGATPVRYGEGLAERVRELGEVTVAIDCAGAPGTNEASLELVADRSRIGTIVRPDLAEQHGFRSFDGRQSPRRLQWRREALVLTLNLLTAGAFRIELGARLPLAEAAEAQRLCDAGSDGKIILLP